MADDAPVPVPLDPFEAKTLFQAGEVLCFVALPADRFVCTQWHGEMAMAVEIPFDDAEAYFAAHPVALWDPAFVNPPRPEAPEPVEGPSWGSLTPDKLGVAASGDIINLTAAFKGSTDQNYDPGAVTWDSTSGGVFSIAQDPDNKLKAVATAKTTSGGSTIKCVSPLNQCTAAIALYVAPDYALPPEPGPITRVEASVVPPDPPAIVKQFLGDVIEVKLRSYDATGMEVPETAIHWWSEPNTVARTVDHGDGTATVTMAGVGTANIRGDLDAAHETYDHFTVEVIDPTPPAPEPAATSVLVILPTGGAKLAPGSTFEAEAVFKDADGNPVAPPASITWASSDPAIATVAQDSVDPAKAIVTAVADGTATITSSATEAEAHG